MKESDFKKKVVDDIKRRLPGSVAVKQDANYIQGIPDMVVFYKNKWAMLEFKNAKNAHRQPNQEFYVKMFDDMSFARFIWPENKEDVIKDLIRFMED